MATTDELSTVNNIKQVIFLHTSN